MSRTLSLTLYNLCLPLGIAGMAPGALKKMRSRGGRWSDFSERLGRFSPEKLSAIGAISKRTNRFWIHAVSVGEVGIARKLIAHLIKTQPDSGVLLTTTTPTGYELASAFAAQHSASIVVCYSPLDLPWVPARIHCAFHPTQIVLVEAEVWPNWVNVARKQGVPVSLINARLSPRSEKRFRMAKAIVSPVFQMLEQVLVQEPEDVDRWLRLGLDPKRVHHTGSVKFDPEGAAVTEAKLNQVRSALSHLGWPSHAPVFLAASTHLGEEVEIARVFRRLQKNHADLRLILVPRHVERTPEILSSLQPLGLVPALRSQVAAEMPSSDCLLVDTTGELSAWQCLATQVVIGKSFLATGGQNPAEALMAGKPVLFGPHMENFDALVHLLLREKGAIQVRDFASLESEFDRLLRDPDIASTMALSGQKALGRHSGATARTVERLLGLKKSEV
jgi:3-deoxy-D-manno-octulosonic-acid transferase